MEWIPGAAALTIWSPEPAAVVAGAAVGGGVREGAGPGRGREGGEGQERQELTRSVEKGMARPEEAGRRGGGARTRRPEAGKSGSIRPIGGSPARSRR